MLKNLLKVRLPMSACSRAQPIGTFQKARQDHLPAPCAGGAGAVQHRESGPEGRVQPGQLPRGPGAVDRARKAAGRQPAAVRGLPGRARSA